LVDGAQGDRLAGVLVTTEYLDLFDMERFLSDNSRGASGGLIVTDSGSREHQGRLYATVIRHSSEDEKTGETFERVEYVFEGINGFAYFVSDETSAVGSYMASNTDEAISDGHVSIHHSDNGISVTMEGTIYILPASMAVFYMNPVYQSADGRVYAVSGSGISTSGVQDEGGFMSQTTTEARTTTQNGRSVTDSASITISIATMYAPEKVVVIQMDLGSNIVAREEFEPGALPESIAPESGVEYIIVETHRRSLDGGDRTSRAIRGRQDTGFETFYARPDGVNVQQSTQILWYDNHTTPVITASAPQSPTIES